KQRALQARCDPEFNARSLCATVGERARGRHAPRTRSCDIETPAVLLRLWRALRHGGARGARPRARPRMSHPGRDPTPEAGWRTTDALDRNIGVSVRDHDLRPDRDAIVEIEHVVSEELEAAS